MTAEQIVSQSLTKAVELLYGVVPQPSQIQVQATRKEFDGDLTAVMFPLLKISHKSPEQTGNELGAKLLEMEPSIAAFNVIKGFLNIQFSGDYWKGFLSQISSEEHYGYTADSGKTFMIEFSSPNTNKPLHLGHVRNNLLGESVARLMEANGHHVIRVNLVNDRGVHICKSMLAWKEFGNGQTPSSTGIKGDHLVGDYYVRFDKEYKAQVKDLTDKGMDSEQAAKEAPFLKQAQEMLLKWEQGDKEVLDLWHTMNEWVYTGFDQTYRRLGVSFDRIYYESQTYLLGKELVQEGLSKGVFYRKEDGSVWCDLTQDGLDQKLLLRSDGTSVYMTQDLGTATRRHKEYGFDKMIYVVGNEQNYHFQVLKLILKKLGMEWADRIYHLSYGMVELPEGKMKSREGTVVDADDLMDAMVETARETSMELGKLEDMDKEQREALFDMLGMGALKYFILKVDPKKTMLFDPKESIDFNGNTGPFIQYTYARICSLLRKAAEAGYPPTITDAPLLDKEIRLVKLMSSFPQVISMAGDDCSPAQIANFAFDLAKEFNQYYHETSVLHENLEAFRSQRLVIIQQVAKMITLSMNILGIKLPSRM